MSPILIVVLLQHYHYSRLEMKMHVSCNIE